MSVYSQYAVGTSNDVAVDESYDGLVGIYRMIEESALNEHAIFEHVIACDFAEAYTENGVMTESSLEAINEASMGEIWGKVKEFVKKMWAKILGIIQNLITKIQSVFIRDGKELVKKFEKKVNSNFNGDKLDKMPVKFMKLNKDDLNKTEVVNIVSTNTSKLGAAYINNSKYAGNMDADIEAGKGDNKTEWKDLPEETKEIFKSFTTEKLDELKNDALGKILGDNKTTDSKTFAKDMMETYLTEVNKEGLTKEDIDYCKGILENSKEILSTLKREESKAKQQFKNDIKDIEAIEKKYSDRSGKTYSAQAGKARGAATRAIQVNSARSNVLGTAYAGITKVYKKAASDARSMWVKAASYGGKAEATLLEAVAEVSDYEVEEMFAM